MHRPRPPDRSGLVERDGVEIAYDVYDADRPTVLLMPTWSIVDSRVWKFQVPYLARHFRVVTFDGRGSGRSGRPVGAAAYADSEYAADAVAVLDATGTERALLVGFSCGVAWSVHVAAGHPDRVSRAGRRSPPPAGCRCASPGARSTPSTRGSTPRRGWAKYNEHYWLRGRLRGLRRASSSSRCSTSRTRPSRSRTSRPGPRRSPPQTLADTTAGRLGLRGAEATALEPLCEQVRCPVVVIHGTEDQVRPGPDRRAAGRADRRPTSCCSRASVTRRRRASRSASTT